MRKFLHVPLMLISAPQLASSGCNDPSRVMPVTRNGLPSTPSNSKHVLPDLLLSTVMIVLSIPAPRMVMAFTLGEWPVCQPLFDQTAVPAGSWTMSPSLAASIAFPTASGVKSAAVRVSA